MAHRAVIARRRPDGRYDLYESRSAGFAIDSTRAHLDANDWRAPLASGLAFGEVIARLDASVHEALYVLGKHDRVFRVLCFRLATADGVIEGDRIAGEGALVAVGDVDDPEPDGYLRGWFEAVRDCIGEAVDRGVLREDEAVPALRERLVRFAGDSVEVITLPPR